VALADKDVAYTFANGVLTVDMAGLGLTAKDSFELQFGGGAMASPAGILSCLIRCNASMPGQCRYPGASRVGASDNNMRLLQLGATLPEPWPTPLTGSAWT
jgi:hypothetical protein